MSQIQYLIGFHFPLTHFQTIPISHYPQEHFFKTKNVVSLVFLDKLETISTQGYIPNLTDISMAQTLSNSIIEQTIVTDRGRFR